MMTMTVKQLLKQNSLALTLSQLRRKPSSCLLFVQPAGGAGCTVSILAWLHPKPVAYRPLQQQ
jgi:hypothetical protein